MPPLVMKTLRPLRTHSSPSRRARVRRLETSEPDWGSVAAKAATSGASGVPNMRGPQAATCSGVPPLKSAINGRPVPTIPIPMPAHPQNSSSVISASVNPLGSWTAWKYTSME